MDWKTNIKMKILPNVVYRFSAILIKIPPAFFTEIEKLILKLMWEYKGPMTTKAI